MRAEENIIWRVCLEKTHSKHAFSYPPREKQAIILKDAECANCIHTQTQTHTNPQSAALIKAAQQHVTAPVSPLHLPQAVPQQMSSPNVLFANRGVVSTVLPGAGAPCSLFWLRAYGAKRHIKFTVE